MTKKQDYENLLEEFHNKVKSDYGRGIGFAWDGPVNSTLWFEDKIPVKILFLLKEAYGVAEEKTDIMDNAKRFNDSNTNKKISLLSYAFQQVIASDAFRDRTLTKETLFNEIDKVYDNKPSYASSEHEIAFSNIAVLEIKKTSGGAISNDREIIKHGQQYADLLKRQIELLQPDIIICGGPVTWKVLTEEIQPFNQESVASQGEAIKTINNTIVVNAYHPSSNVVHWYEQVFNLVDFYYNQLEKTMQGQDTP